MLVSVLGIVTLFQLVKLTILDSTLYTTLSDENRIIRVPIYPSRGLIKLSNDEIVTENIVSQALTMVPAKTQDMEKILRELRADLLIDDKQLLALKERVVIVENLSPEQIAKFSVEKDKWPNLSIEARLMRFNLLGPLFSHVLGYVGQINLEEIEDSKDFVYPLSFLTGKTGVEKFYEEDMRGGVGYKTIEVDVNGKEIRELNRVVPNKGRDVYLTLDKELQKLARKELTGRKGAVVALDPNTGFLIELFQVIIHLPQPLNPLLVFWD